MFDQNTIDVLRNFKLINNSMVFKKGNIIQVMANTESLLAQVELKEKITQDFAVYDMHQFLSVLQLFTEKCKTEFFDTHVKLKESGRLSTYHFCSPGIIKEPPYEELAVEGDTTEFDFDMANFIKRAMILDLPNINFQIVDGKYSVMACNHKNVTNNNYVEQTNLDKGIKQSVLLEKLKLIDSDHYNVIINSSGLITMKTTYKDLKVTYYIAADEE
jgi:hypothetical protein